VIAYYPGCQKVRPWKSDVPVLVLFGENDDVVSLDKCRRIFSELHDSETIALHTYPDSLHAFDFAGLPAKTKYRSGTVGYNETAAKAAWNELRRFIKR